MGIKGLVENVIVNNGIEEHKVQYVYSPRKIKNIVHYVVNHLTPEFIDLINERNEEIYIVTDEQYSEIKLCYIDSNIKEITLKFKELTLNIK